jgi:lysine-N-methylase
MKFLTYDFYNNFHCIGGLCEDSCCIGWEVGIDSTTYEKYKKLENSPLKDKLRRNLKKNSYVIDNSINYGRLKLENNRCSMLDKDNLCIIQKHKGEMYLSNVCTLFPRTINKLGNYYELSLDLSCPPAAKMILENNFSLEMIETKLEPSIVTYEVNDEFSNKAIPNIRAMVFNIVDNNSLNLGLRIIDEYVSDIKPLIISKNFNKIAAYKVKNIKNDEILNLYNYAFLDKFLKDLNIENEIDSIRFKNIYKEYRRKYKLIESSNLKSFNLKYVDFLLTNEAVIKRYIKNYVFKNLFPFTESVDPYESFKIMTLKLYLIIHLTITTEHELIELIQIFSKSIDHNHNFIEKAQNSISKIK